MTKKKAQAPDPASNEFADQLAEIREIEQVAAAVPSDAANRDELIAEQMIVRAEQAARDEGKPYRYEIDADGAKFVTKEAAELHVRSFHPTPPKGATPRAPFAMPVTVVKEEAATAKAASIGKASPDDEQD